MKQLLLLVTENDLDEIAYGLECLIVEKADRPNDKVLLQELIDKLRHQQQAQQLPYTNLHILYASLGELFENYHPTLPIP